MALDKLRQEWSDMDPKFRWIIGAVAVVGVGFMVYRQAHPAAPRAVAESSKSAPLLGADGRPVDPFRTRLLPETPRNQGLENVSSAVQGLKDEVTKLKAVVATLPRPEAPINAARAAFATTGASAAAASAPRIDLDARLPEVSFEQPGSRGAGPTAAGPAPAAASAPEAVQTMRVWPADEVQAPTKGDASSLGGPVVPVNSALESVMLSGINARPSGSTAGAVGSVISANKVGAPFVTRIKGDAILPNGWRLSDLGDCFLGGSGIAVLSTERANVIADVLSCIAPDGEVWETPIAAYGLDVDGTLGIAGKVVSKQGSLLMQSALTGMASGLGSALTPSSIPAYNSNATSGSTTGVQYPSLGAVAQTSVGQGLNHATAQLSKFYLDYAREVFPVVEVTSGTRVTWILSKSAELKRRINKVALQ